MGKKRKATERGAAGPKTFNTADSKIGTIRTFEDVADSEDEFHINRDKVLLEDAPDAKRRRKLEDQDAFLQLSDEEVLGYTSSSSENEEEEDEVRAPKEPAARPKDTLNSGRPVDEEEEEGWGTSKRDYYNADNIETEADALEEEAEAKRLQQKKLQKMSEADFGFDESEWLEAENDENDGEVVTEVLKEVEITSEMGSAERLKILHMRYPEFESLANEFVQLQPILGAMQLEPASTQTGISLIKIRALAAYVSSLAMYFAILTSTSKNGKEGETAFNSLELRDHNVMESLLDCRQMWTKVKGLRDSNVTTVDLAEDLSSAESETFRVNAVSNDQISKTPQTKRSRKELARQSAVAEASRIRSERIQAAEEDLADLSNLVPKGKVTSKGSRSKHAHAVVDDDSDFGEEESLDARSAAEKAAKKKSLRFYTSQIAQKANRRADAGRDAGGDADLPYRERLRDRQARLNAEAEKRSKKLDEYGRGTELGGDSDSGDEGEKTAAALRDDEDDYYDLVAKTSKARKDDKNEQYELMAAEKAAGKQLRVVEGEVGEDGKRAIGYVIQKNKGLAPKRKKDVRNPRVKKRKKYEEKKKKLASTRAVYKGGEERGGYGGEKTGIKTGLIKSIKL